MTIKLYPSQVTPLPGDAGPLPYATYVRLRQAARRARHVYPGRLGDLVARELEACADAGHHVAEDGLVVLLAAEILDEPVVETTQDVRPPRSITRGRPRRSAC